MTYQSRSARDAVRKAKTIGKSKEVRFDSGHRLRFVGILQCMDLEFQDPGEVWWEFTRRRNPDRWARRTIPAERALYVFTDRKSKGGTPANTALQPASRAKRKAKTTRRPRAARG